MVNIEQIISVSSKPTLYKLISTKPNGLILEDLANGKTNFYSSRTYQFSPLESIGIYTLSDNLPLKDVYTRFLDNENKETVPAIETSDTDLKAYFEKIIPEYDHYRVHTRDMRKCVKWFYQLKALGFIKNEEKQINQEEE